MRALLIATLAVATLAAAPARAQHDHGAAPATGSAHAQAQAWTDAPRLTAQGRDRAAILYRAEGLEAGALRVHPPRGEAWTVPLDGKARVTQGAAGNYHLVVARAVGALEERTAATARYFFEPGPDPRPFLEAPHRGLMLLPEQLPREHRHFTSGETWAFRLRHDGAPVAGQAVLLETVNGSRVRALTDADGIARVTFPSDFAPPAPPDEAAGGGHGGHGGARLPFVVSATVERDGRILTAAYNDVYEDDATVQASLPAGAAFLALGMLAATPLLRRRASGGAR